MDKEEMIKNIQTGERACRCLIEIIKRLEDLHELDKIQDILNKYFVEG